MLGRFLPQLSSQARSLLAAERNRQEPEDEALKRRAVARARAALEQGRPSGFALRSSSGPSGGPRRSVRTVALVAAAMAAAGLAAAGAGLWQAQHANSSAPVRRSAALPVPSALAVGGALPLGTSAAPIQAPPPQATRPQSDGLVPVERARPSTVQQYKLELVLLEPARSKIGRGDYVGALAAIAHHQRDFPGGLLAEEREALRVRALWGMGRVPEAEAAAKLFRKRYPRSLLLGWMKKTDPASP